MSNPIKFCAGSICGGVEIAIGGYRSRDYCRADYVEFVRPHLVRATVVGPCKVTGVDRVDVARGGVVELDPEETNLPALVYAGHIKLDAEQVKTLKKR